MVHPSGTSAHVAGGLQRRFAHDRHSIYIDLYTVCIRVQLSIPRTAAEVADHAVATMVRETHEDAHGWHVAAAEKLKQ